MSAIVAELGTIQPLTSRTVVPKPRLDFPNHIAARTACFVRQSLSGSLRRNPRFHEAGQKVSSQ